MTAPLGCDAVSVPARLGPLLPELEQLRDALLSGASRRGDRAARIGVEVMGKGRVRRPREDHGDPHEESDKRQEQLD